MTSKLTVGFENIAKSRVWYVVPEAKGVVLYIEEAKSKKYIKFYSKPPEPPIPYKESLSTAIILSNTTE